MTAIPALILATTVVATGASIYQGQQSQKAQTKALNFQRQQSALQSAMQKRQAIRQARIVAGASTQMANNTGAANSSSAEGAYGSIQSQLSGNLSFLDQNQTLADQASVQLGKAATANTNAQAFSAAAQLGWTAYGSGIGGKKTK